MGLLDSTPAAKANQLLIDNAAKLASQSAARQAVRMGASESAVGLAAALEASGAPILAQLVTKSWQGAAAFGAGYAIGYAGTYGYYAVKEVFNPKAAPNSIEEMRKAIDARPYDSRSENYSANQCKGKKLEDYFPFFQVPYKKYDLAKALNTAVIEACKTQKFSCDDPKEYENIPEAKRPAFFFERLTKGRQCFEARETTMNQCFFGGDLAHRKQAKSTLDAMQICRDNIKLTP